jgi:hypothetical protein
MSRSDLLNRDYRFEVKEPKKAVINAIWASLALPFMAFSVLLFFAIMVGSFDNMSLPYIEFNAYVINVIFIAAPFAYFIFKDIMTSSFCSNSDNVIKADLSLKTEMPAWNYREAFKAWQIIVIHLVPAVSMYPVLLGLGVLSGGEISLLILVLIMTFFITSDLTLVIYILFSKVRHNAEYIAINNHVYSLTLYSMKSGINKKAYDLKTIEEKLSKKYFRKPMFFTGRRLSAIKKAACILVFAGLVSGFAIYAKINSGKNTMANPDDFENHIERCSAMNPAIKDYRGDSYANYDITKSGYYTGSENILAGNAIYCGDDSSVIYFDGETDSLVRLGLNDISERLCVYEDCRNDLEKSCGHMPNFVSGGTYSDGVLYGIQAYPSADKKGREVLKSYIIRYDIVFGAMDKLIEFEMGDEDAHIHRIFTCGRYLYAVVSAKTTVAVYGEMVEEMTQLTVVRVDLEEENACVLYSDNIDMGNRDKIENLASNKNQILVSADGVLYLCDPDLRFFWPLFMGEYGIIRHIDTNERDIYVLAGDTVYGFLYDAKEKKYSARAALGNVNNFCVESGFLYYTPNGKNTIFRVELDTDLERMPHMDYLLRSIAANAPEKDYSDGEWIIRNGYIYTLLHSDDGYPALSRAKMK